LPRPRSPTGGRTTSRTSSACLAWSLPQRLTFRTLRLRPTDGAFHDDGSLFDLTGDRDQRPSSRPILVKGIRESASFNAAMVMIKLVIVLFVIGLGAFYVDPANWKPFAPYGYTGLAFFGKTLHRTGPAPRRARSACSRVCGRDLLRVHRLSTRCPLHAEEAKRPAAGCPDRDQSRRW